jgi:hypothetical protein
MPSPPPIGSFVLVQAGPACHGLTGGLADQVPRNLESRLHGAAIRCHGALHVRACYITGEYREGQTLPSVVQVVLDVCLGIPSNLSSCAEKMQSQR